MLLTRTPQMPFAPAPPPAESPLPSSEVRTSPGRFSAPAPGKERAALFAEFQPLVSRLVRTYGNHPEIREDLPGEIYCRFEMLLDAYDPSRGVPLRPYLVRNLTLAAYTYSRSARRRRSREAAWNAELVDSTTLSVANRGTDLNDKLAAEAVLAALPKVIATLPRRQREVLILRYYDSRGFEEIAERLGVTTATARSLLRHAMARLRSRFAGEETADLLAA